ALAEEAVVERQRHIAALRQRSGVVALRLLLDRGQGAIDHERRTPAFTGWNVQRPDQRCAFGLERDTPRLDHGMPPRWGRGGARIQPEGEPEKPLALSATFPGSDMAGRLLHPGNVRLDEQPADLRPLRPERGLEGVDRVAHLVARELRGEAHLEGDQHLARALL